MRKTNTGKGTALVIGATGGIGGEVARALIADGWRVRGLARDIARAKDRVAWAGPIEWVAGDAMSAEDVTAAAAGSEVIFHGANPPGYKDWRGLAIPMLANSIAAARRADARLIFPGNVYNFGPDAGSLLTEDSPQNPLTRKGAVRVEMEGMLREMADSGGRAMIVRAGDFFGPRQPASWFKNAIVKPGKPLRAVTYPGEPAVGHAWAYLPDLADAIASLAAIETALPAFDRFHFGGHWMARGDEIVAAIRRVSGRPDLPMRRLPWIVFHLAAPFATFFREALEMRYLWRTPVRLDNAKLVAALGAEPRTPLDQAIGRTLTALNCVDAASDGPAAIPSTV